MGVAQEAARFFLTTLSGLAVDLGAYWLLVWLWAPPGVANIVSSAMAVLVLYVVNTRYTFRVRPSRWAPVLFFCWYAFSIFAFSIMIQLVSPMLGPMIAKLASLPLSFLANFLVVRLILRAPRPRTAKP